MKLIPGGEFTMGTDDARSMPSERPAHRVRVDAFWLDEHPVTNAEFRRFVGATGYVTTAERKPDWEELKKQLPPGTPKPDESLMVPSQGLCENPTGPDKTFDPADPYSERRVIKGGSYLCHTSYCESYRPSARRGTPPDTGSSHVGFRLALSATG